MNRWTRIASWATALLVTAVNIAIAAESRCTTPKGEFADTVKSATEFMANSTYRSYSPGHGNQIEYASKDDRVFLWYPGNTVIVPGDWKVEDDIPLGSDNCGRPQRLIKLCFRYGANSYNPVTHTQGGAWECEPFFIFKLSRKEVVKGDPLGLAKMGKPPFPLPREEQPISRVMAQLHGVPK